MGRSRMLRSAENLCSFCLGYNDNESLIDLNSTFAINDDAYIYKDVVETCFCLLVNIDCAPRICRWCASELERTWNFFTRIKASQAELQKIINYQQDPASRSPVNAMIDDVLFKKEIVVMDNDVNHTPPNEEVKQEFICTSDDIHSNEINEENESYTISENQVHTQMFNLRVDYKPFESTASISNSVNSANQTQNIIDNNESSEILPSFDGHKCYKCSRTYLQKRSLIRHLKTHTDKNYLKETQLNTIEIKNNNILASTDRLSDRGYFKTYSSKDEARNPLSKHADINSTEINHTMPTSEYSDLRLSNEFVCDICAKIFRSKRYVLVHMKTHSTERYPCEICTKTFKNKACLRIHTMNHSQRVYRHKCKKCPEKFDDYYKLEIHLSRIHNETKIYKCKLCPKVFNFAYRRTKHFGLKHANRYKYKCTNCTYSIHRKDMFEDHMVTHNCTRNFICDLCNKSFARRRSIIDHFKIHNNIRNNVCQFCNKTFIQKCNLNTHLKSIHNCMLSVKK